MLCLELHQHHTLSHMQTRLGLVGPALKTQSDANLSFWCEDVRGWLATGDMSTIWAIGEEGRGAEEREG